MRGGQGYFAEIYPYETLKRFPAVEQEFYALIGIVLYCIFLTMASQPSTQKIVWFGPLLTIALAAAMTAFKWDSLPDRIALHSGSNGPDIWIKTSPEAVYGFLMAGAVICGSMLAGSLLLRMLRRPTPSQLTGSLLLPISYMVAIGFALAPLAAIFRLDAGLLVLISTAIVVGVMGLQLRRSLTQRRNALPNS